MKICLDKEIPKAVFKLLEEKCSKHPIGVFEGCCYNAEILGISLDALRDCIAAMMLKSKATKEATNALYSFSQLINDFNKIKHSLFNFSYMMNKSAKIKSKLITFEND